MGNEVFEMHPGDSWAVVGDMEHRAEILADSIAIKVFAPRREDFLSPQSNSGSTDSQIDINYSICPAYSFLRSVSRYRISYDRCHRIAPAYPGRTDI